MSSVAEAVILMAGAGSRLRAGGHDLPKPLVRLLDRPLVSYIFESLSRAGITTIHAVVGYCRDQVVAEAERFRPADVALHFIENPEWEKQNGISVLAAGGNVNAPFLLTMTDHIFDQAIVDQVVRQALPDQLNLAVDRKIKSIYDLDDATKVVTDGDRIVEIGKTIETYDAVDTGIFVCPAEIFEHLEKAKHDSDCSLSDGVRSMARENKARVIDIGDAWWQDVDRTDMLAVAEKHLLAQVTRG